MGLTISVSVRSAAVGQVATAMVEYRGITISTIVASVTITIAVTGAYMVSKVIGIMAVVVVMVVIMVADVALLSNSLDMLSICLRRTIPRARRKIRGPWSGLAI